MDGASIGAAFGSAPGPDCLKEFVRRCGPRLKVYAFLKSAWEDLDAHVSNELIIF